MTMQPEQLKAIRKALGLTQAELAEQLGLSMNFVSMMERGDKPIEPRTELAMRYLDACGIEGTPPLERATGAAWNHLLAKGVRCDPEAGTIHEAFDMAGMIKAALTAKAAPSLAPADPPPSRSRTS